MFNRAENDLLFTIYASHVTIRLHIFKPFLLTNEGLNFICNIGGKQMTSELKYSIDELKQKLEELKDYL